MKDSKPIVLGINGFKKSGKTTLIERLLKVLAQQGLRLAVIKSHNEPVVTDKPGTDTDRFYRGGANVLSYDGQSVFLKQHQKDAFCLEEALIKIGNCYDLILVEGFKESDIEKIWLLRKDETKPPENILHIITVLKWADEPQQRLEQALKLLQRRLGKLNEG